MQDDETAEHPARRHWRSFPIYVGAGGIATASHYAVTIAAVERFAVAPIAATVMGFLTGSAIKYGLNYSAAFRSRTPHAHAVPRFLIALAVMLGLNTLIFAVLERGVGLHYLLAQVVTTILLIPPGYLLHRQWVFR
ncbi:MAG TPA: GtrA family protein [Usitatibacter sp.]|nr:GtrA family protein [Usitatibacter sp.]